MNKLLTVLLVVSVCVLSFVCYKQHKEIKHLHSEISSLGSQYDSLESYCNELQQTQHELESEISILREEIGNGYINDSAPTRHKGNSQMSEKTRQLWEKINNMSPSELAEYMDNIRR